MFFAAHLSRLTLVIFAVLLLSGAGAVFLLEESFGRSAGVRGVLTPEVSETPELAGGPPSEPRKPSGKPDVAGQPPKPEGPAFDAKALERRLEEIAASHAGRYGVVVLDPASGKTVKTNAGKSFEAASIGKLPALITLYRAAERGELDLDDRISIRPSDFQAGSGVLLNYPAGTSMSLRKCAYLLVNESDNTAWSMLTRYLGREAIQSEVESIGADSTRYWIPNTTTPEDVLLMLEDISDPSFTSKAASDEMLDAMTNTYLEDRIPAGLPPGVRVAHKVGTYATSFGDAGIVFSKNHDSRKRYYIVVLSGGTSEPVARDAIREMASAAHEAISGAGPKPAEDGKAPG